jgi:hypothetical protein
MLCGNCKNFNPEDYCCTVQCGQYQVDTPETDGCPYWDPISRQEEEKRTETYGTPGCLIMILLLPFLLILKLI